MPKLLGGLAPRPRQTAAHLFHVLAIAAAGQHARDELGRDRARSAEIGCDLEIHKIGDPVRPRGDVPAPHRGGECLGEAADADHAIKSVERGQPRRGLWFKIGEDVVLHDRQVVHGGRVQHAVRRLRRERRTGWVMQRRVGDVEARALRREGRLEGGNVGPRRRVGNADHLGPVRAQQRMEIEIAGIVDQHRVARAKQETADQVDGLRPGRCQQQLIGRHLDAFFGKTPHQDATKRQRATRDAIVREHGHLGSCQRAEGPTQRIGRHPVGR